MKCIKIIIVHENSNNYKAGIQMTKVWEGCDKAPWANPLVIKDDKPNS